MKMHCKPKAGRILRLKTLNPLSIISKFVGKVTTQLNEMLRAICKFEYKCFAFVVRLLRLNKVCAVSNIFLQSAKRPRTFSFSVTAFIALSILNIMR